MHRSEKFPTFRLFSSVQGFRKDFSLDSITPPTPLSLRIFQMSGKLSRGGHRSPKISANRSTLAARSDTTTQPTEWMEKFPQQKDLAGCDLFLPGARCPIRSSR